MRAKAVTRVTSSTVIPSTELSARDAQRIRGRPLYRTRHDSPRHPSKLAGPSPPRHRLEGGQDRGTGCCRLGHRQRGRLSGDALRRSLVSARRHSRVRDPRSLQHSAAKTYPRRALYYIRSRVIRSSCAYTPSVLLCVCLCTGRPGRVYRVVIVAVEDPALLYFQLSYCDLLENVSKSQH